MRNTKKFLAALMAATMILGLTACGGETSVSQSASASASKTETETAKTETSTSTSEEEKKEEPAAPLKISIVLPSDKLHDEPDANYDALVKAINEYTNMDVQYEWEDMNDKENGYYPKLTLKYAANDFRDVMVVGNDPAFQAVAKDYFWDLTDYIDEFDNLRTIPAATRANCSYEGRIYGIPRSRTLARNGFGYRADWCDALGINAPTTWDDYYDMCYKFTYNDPDGNGKNDTYGLALDAWTGVYNIIFVFFGVPNEWGIDANGDLIPAHLTEEWKTALKAMRKLYADGCINPNFKDINPGKARDELLRTGICGSGFQVLDDQRKVETYFEGADVALAEPDDPIYLLGGYLLTDSGKNQPHCLPTTGMNNMIAISKKNITTEDQLRQVLGFLNDLNDGEMLNLIDYGFEGVTWNKDDEGYIHVLTQDELDAAGTVGTYRNGFNQMIPYFTAPENDRTITVPPANTVVTKLEQQLYAEDIPYCVPNYGAGYYSETNKEKGGDLAALISDLENGAIVRYMTGEIDDAGLDEILNTWRTAGGDQVIAEMNAAYHAAGN